MKETLTNWAKEAFEISLALLLLHISVGGFAAVILTIEEDTIYFVDNWFLDLLFLIIIMVQISFAVTWLIALLVKIRAYMLKEAADYKRKKLTLRELRQKNYDFSGDDDIWPYR